MCNFVSGNKAGRALFPETKLRTQKYSDTTAVVWRIRKYKDPKSRIGGNSGFVPTQIQIIITLKFKKTYGGNLGIFESYFRISATWATQECRQN